MNRPLESLLQPHPAAELFPLLEGEEFETLKRNIAEHGLLTPIWLCDDQILDGRNRYRACVEIGVEPIFQTYTGSSPVEFAWSLNGVRRHLTKSQLALIAVKMLAPLKAEAKKRQATSTGGAHPQLTPVLVEAGKGTAVEQAAALVGVGKTNVQYAKSIVENAPELVADIQSGKISIDKAIQIKRGMPEKKRVGALPRAERVAQISAMAAEGYRSQQIADKLGIGDHRVRQLAQQENITLADKAIGRVHKINASRVIEETIVGLEGLALGLDVIGVVIDVSKEQATEWVTSMTRSIKRISKLRAQLSEIAK